MTTTAWAPPGFEIKLPSDMMDIHSDKGVDVDNADVDIDFDPSRSPATYADDLSLKDAVLDGELGPQTASADQDDFMADNEDLIEEDTTAYNEDAVLVEENSASQNEVEQLVDDDLIDYSDDEEDSSSKGNITSKNTDLTSIQNDTSASAAVSSVNEVDPTSNGIDTTAVETTHEYDEPKNDDLETSGDAEENWQEETGHQPELSNYVDTDSNAVVPEQNQHAHEDQGVQKHNDSEDVNYVAHASNAIASPSGQEIELHPVTINYSGAELWLFKHHDYEDSGDYLVEDTSLTNKPISSVLEACRSALGEDVSDDIELGFRLDNFRNIELYQDHSSCAFITLEHIVGLYLQLHAQDGISDPESFYMTLLSRPRVSALFNALNEAASEGIGHVGLEKAIAAGLTSFNARLSHNNAVNNYDDWGNEEEHQGHVADGVGDNEVEEKEDGVHETDNEHEEEEQYEGSAQAQEGDAQNLEPAEGVVEPTAQYQDSFAATGALSDPENVTLNVADENRVPPASNTGSPRADEKAGNNDVQKTPSQQEDDDFVDYSDDEDDDQTPPEDSVRQPSSLSSTVQGDDTAPVQEVDEQLEGQAVAESDPSRSNDYHEVEDEEDYAQYGDADGFDAQAYEEYDEQYDEQYDELHAPEHTEIDVVQEAPPSQHDTNNYYLGSEEQAAGHYDGVTAGVDNYDAQVTVAGGGSIVGDDGLANFDLADVTADVTSYDAVGDAAFNDEYSHNDENDEDGQAQVAAASADVDPVATLSSESLNLSPQGQKRTIDEVGNDVGEATDPSDAKRPRV